MGDAFSGSVQFSPSTDRVGGGNMTEESSEISLPVFSAGGHREHAILARAGMSIF